MLRSLVGRTLSLVRPTAPSPFRSYVTARQIVIEKEAMRKAEMLVNVRTSIPEPTLAPHALRYLRTDPLLSQLVNMVMRDGKKARAERLVQTALLDIRRYTNTDPMRVLSDAINLACPLMDTKSARQGSKVVQVPRALNLRQRRRRAIVWILDSADRRNERCFSMRLSGELQAIVNGTSGVLEKKLLLHKAVLANRSFIRTNTRKLRK